MRKRTALRREIVSRLKKLNSSVPGGLALPERNFTSKKFGGSLAAALLAAVLMFAGWTAAAESAPRDIRVLTSFYPMYVMAMNVLKDVKGVSLTNLAPSATGCLHDYVLTPGDMAKIERADILIANGAGAESFLIKVAKKYPRLRVVELAGGIPLIQGSQGPNPHVWVSIGYAIAEVRNLSRFMARIDANNAAAYEKNGEAYVARLEALRREMHAALDAYRGTPIVTFHEAFPYFAQEFGLTIAAVVEREPGSEPSARELADTIGIIKKLRVKALFSEPQYPATAAAVIARETGVRLYQLDPAVTGPESPDAYLDIMRRNTEILKEALK